MVMLCLSVIAVCGADTVVLLCPLPMVYTCPSSTLYEVRYPLDTTVLRSQPEMFHKPSPVFASMTNSLPPLHKTESEECSSLAMYIFPSVMVKPLYVGHVP